MLLHLLLSYFSILSRRTRRCCLDKQGFSFSGDDVVILGSASCEWLENGESDRNWGLIQRVVLFDYGPGHVNLSEDVIKVEDLTCSTLRGTFCGFSLLLALAARIGSVDISRSEDTK